MIYILGYILEGVCKEVIPGNSTCSNPDEAKNRLTVIIKQAGIYDIEQIRQKVDIYLISVKNDISIDNIWISYFTGSSKEELDSFIEGLYCNENVFFYFDTGAMMMSIPANVSNTGELTIGKWDGENSFNGIIDEVKVYNNALAREQILETYIQTAIA